MIGEMPWYQNLLDKYDGWMAQRSLRKRTKQIDSYIAYFVECDRLTNEEIWNIDVYLKPLMIARYINNFYSDAVEYQTNHGDNKNTYEALLEKQYLEYVAKALANYSATIPQIFGETPISGFDLRDQNIDFNFPTPQSGGRWVNGYKLNQIMCDNGLNAIGYLDSLERALPKLILQRPSLAQKIDLDTLKAEAIALSEKRFVPALPKVE
ncbi:MAG: hypothetical protein Fur003_5100 [Candidatus Dojkabacteria bacterium]